MLNPIRLLLIFAWIGAAACGGCHEAPPFDQGVFITPESVEIYGDVVCDGAVGIVAPLPTCYPERPCDRVLPIPGRSNDPITVPTHVPDCETDGRDDDRPALSDGEPMTFVDRDNVRRRYCLHDPGGPRLPLVLWYHGSGGSADNVYDATSLRTKAETFEFSQGTPGFILLSVEGRNLHWPTADPRDGPHHDVFHRDLGYPSDNRDIAMADHLIDQYVDSGRADPRRIYVMGWSNGMHFAQMYGIARHEGRTPGGNHVAAVAGYSAADPFNDRAFDQEPSCQLTEYPESEVPILLVGRSCDAIPCSDAQYERALDKDRPVAPGTSQETWMQTLKDRIGDPNVERLIIDNDGAEVSSCMPATKCRAARALLNHVRWPDGIADEGGHDSEPRMLEFLRDHPLPSVAVEGD